MTETLNKEKILELAKRHVDEGRIERAIQEYQKIAAADPRDFRVQLRIADLFVRIKQVPQAVTAYQTVANAYADEGFYLKAVTVYKNILRLNPSLRVVNERLAELYEKMGLAQDAIHQYQILASVWEQKGDHKQLLQLRRRIVALDPMNVTNRVRLAEAYQVDGQDQACLQEYETLAEQLKDKGTTEQLIDLYEKILTRRQDHREYLQRLCRIYDQQGEYKKALRRMEASQATVGKDVELLTIQADIYFRLNQAETAKGKWRELAELHRQAGAAAEALAACERILVVSPEDADDLAELIESIEAGATERIRQRADERRVAMAKEEETKEALEVARQEAAEQISVREETTSSPPTVSRSAAAPAKGPEKGPAKGIAARPPIAVGTDPASLQSAAEASEGLAKMYQQMGLADEAKEEFAKALTAYRRLLVAGVGGTEVLERVRALEVLMPEEGSLKPEPKVEPPPKKASPVAGRRSSATDKPQPASPSGGVDKKKRISFV